MPAKKGSEAADVKVLSRKASHSTVRLIVGESEDSWPRYKIRVLAPEFVNVAAIFQVSVRLTAANKRYKRINAIPLWMVSFLMQGVKNGKRGTPPGPFDSMVQGDVGVSVSELIHTAVALQEVGSYWVGTDEWIAPWTERWTRDDYVQVAGGRFGGRLSSGEGALRQLLERFNVTGEWFTAEVLNYIEMGDVVREFERAQGSGEPG